MDSRHLSADVAATVPRIVAAISKGYQQQLAAGTGEHPLSKRCVDDSKVSDHHAIIPTAVSGEQAHLGADEHKIYDRICRRFVMMWHDDHLQALTTVITAIEGKLCSTHLFQTDFRLLDLTKVALRGLGISPRHFIDTTKLIPAEITRQVDNLLPLR